MDQNSMLIWWPVVKDLGIPVPRTEIVEIDWIDSMLFANGEGPLPNEEAVLEAVNRIGYPLFVRTDLASYKHGWKDSSFVGDEQDLYEHIAKVIEFNECATLPGLNYCALAFRELLQLKSSFTAFNGSLPISKERRYFINDGNVVSHNPYWPLECIQEPSVEDWKEHLKELNKETPDEISLLSDYAETVSKVLPGYWSVDFACDVDGKWWLIDMATGEDSWKPDETVTF